MSLRGFVTGGDACTPSDGGAGPSNAMASLANSILGGSSKTQEQLREVWGLANLYKSCYCPATSLAHEIICHAAHVWHISSKFWYCSAGKSLYLTKYACLYSCLESCLVACRPHLRGPVQQLTWLLTSHRVSSCQVAPCQDMHASLSVSRGHTPLHGSRACSILLLISLW